MSTTLIAKISPDQSMTAYRKVLTSDKDIFRLPDNLATSNEYNPNTVLEDNEWFKLAAFASKPYCLELLQQPSFSSVDFDSIKNGDFGKIIFICGYQNEHFFFQRVTPARQIDRKRIFIGAECKYEENSRSIALKDYADAIYSSTEYTLYFQNLRNISAIFNGINELYQEATEEEVKEFLSFGFLELTEGFTSDNVKINNRKRIALALETLRHFSEEEKETVFEYIDDYCPELEKTNNKFTIHNEDSLKKLLYGIEQRYYTTLVGEEQRLANSIIPLRQQQGQSNQ